MKLAYWPGCVSRGFTPELHGSMELVAPKLDLELVELDRANCCGAGVIAEHNQELADTLNARTFGMAQKVDGALGMMNICSTCQGAQSECQERLDADSDSGARCEFTSLRYSDDASSRSWHSDCAPWQVEQMFIMPSAPSTACAIANVRAFRVSASSWLCSAITPAPQQFARSSSMSSRSSMGATLATAP